MAYLRPVSQCVCGVCPGFERPANPEEFGGWICQCSCHHSKKFKEDRALEAIMVGVLRGFTKKDWDKVFKRMDEIEAEKKSAAGEKGKP